MPDQGSPKPPKPKSVRVQLREEQDMLALAETRHARKLMEALDAAEARALAGVQDMYYAGQEYREPDVIAARRARLQALGEATAANNLVLPPEVDEPGWVAVMSGSAQTMAKTLPELRDPITVRNQAYRLWRLQPQARGILRNFQRFIVGREFSVDFADTAHGVWTDDAHTKLRETPGLPAKPRPGVVPKKASELDPVMVQLVFKDFAKRNRWKARIKETVLRTFRDGEAFVRRFVRNGKLDIRFIEPERVTSGDTGGQVGMPKDGPGVQPGDLDGDDRVGERTKILAGVEFLETDIETVVAYYFQAGIAAARGRVTRVPAREVVHFKALADSADLRGIPLLEVVFKRLVNYDQWEEYRMVLNKVRTAVVMVRKVEGTASQAAAIIAGRGSPRGAPRNLVEPQTESGHREAMFRAGTTLTPGPGVDYEFKNPNLNARDAAEDGRRFLLSVAAGSGLPEMLITGDWSNSNFASSVEARTPAVREWEDWQEFFEEGMVRILDWMLQAAMGKLEYWDPETKAIKNGGSLGLPDDTDTEVTLQWGTLIAKDRLKDTERYMNLWASGILSKTTWTALEDLDHDAEQENLREEAEEAAAAAAQGVPPPGGTLDLTKVPNVLPAGPIAPAGAPGNPVTPPPGSAPRRGPGPDSQQAPKGPPTQEALLEARAELREALATLSPRMPGAGQTRATLRGYLDRVEARLEEMQEDKDALGHGSYPKSERGITHADLPSRVAGHDVVRVPSTVYRNAGVTGQRVMYELHVDGKNLGNVQRKTEAGGGHERSNQMRYSAWAIHGSSHTSRETAEREMIRRAENFGHIAKPASEAALAEDDHAYATTQLDVPDDLAAEMDDWVAEHVDPEDLDPDEEVGPRHVTVRYGLEDDDPYAGGAAGVTTGFDGPVTVTLGLTTVFHTPDHDVLVVHAEGPDLRRLNAELANALPHTDTQPSYAPHVTLAYLKPGTGDAYAGDPTFSGRTFTADAVTFVPADGDEAPTDIPLAEDGPPDEARDDHGKWTSGGGGASAQLGDRLAQEAVDSTAFPVATGLVPGAPLARDAETSAPTRRKRKRRRVVQEVTDASGHEHLPAGSPEGGEFTSKGDAGGGVPVQRHRREAGPDVPGAEAPGPHHEGGQV